MSNIDDLYKNRRDEYKSRIDAGEEDFDKSFRGDVLILALIDRYRSCRIDGMVLNGRKGEESFQYHITDKAGKRLGVIGDWFGDHGYEATIHVNRRLYDLALGGSAETIAARIQAFADEHLTL
jgi:hypothetical protein